MAILWATATRARFGPRRLTRRRYFSRRKVEFLVREAETAACTRAVVRWMLPFRTWVALDLSALRPLPGQVPDQAVNRAQVGKATTSGPTSARITVARVRSTPGMVHRRAMISL